MLDPGPGRAGFARRIRPEGPTDILFPPAGAQGAGKLPAHLSPRSLQLRCTPPR